eukprot:TRINITY_DN1256_c0_g1_i1.p1 TRINITY_DN1256_c0_g1~~TRINITY_DN1256_c0_g1_i1.p1  ORF type:complete len:416 (-),score=123.96 TRINITY_DN1256_c0_g1_i1:54-1301(-)
MGDQETTEPEAKKSKGNEEGVDMEWDLLTGRKNEGILVPIDLLSVPKSSTSTEDARRKIPTQKKAEVERKSKRERKREKDRQWKEGRRIQINKEIERIDEEIKKALDSNAPGAIETKESLIDQRQKQQDLLFFLDSRFPRWTANKHTPINNKEEEEKKKRRIRLDKVDKDEVIDDIIGDLAENYNIEIDEEESGIIKGPDFNQVIILLKKETELAKLHNYKNEFGNLHRNQERRNKCYRAFVGVKHESINLVLLKEKIYERTGERPTVAEYNNNISATFNTKEACDRLCKPPGFKAEDVQAIIKTRRVTFKPSINNIYNNRYVLYAENLPRFTTESTILDRLASYKINAVAAAKVGNKDNYGLIAFATPEDARQAIKINPVIGDGIDGIKLSKAYQHEKHFYWNTEWIHMKVEKQ